LLETLVSLLAWPGVQVVIEASGQQVRLADVKNSKIPWPVKKQIPPIDSRTVKSRLEVFADFLRK